MIFGFIKMGFKSLHYTDDYVLTFSLEKSLLCVSRCWRAKNNLLIQWKIISWVSENLVYSDTVTIAHMQTRTFLKFLLWLHGFAITVVGFVLLLPILFTNVQFNSAFIRNVPSRAHGHTHIHTIEASNSLRCLHCPLIFNSFNVENWSSVALCNENKFSVWVYISIEIKGEWVLSFVVFNSLTIHKIIMHTIELCHRNTKCLYNLKLYVYIDIFLVIGNPKEKKKYGTAVDFCSVTLETVLFVPKYVQLFRKLSTN